MQCQQSGIHIGRSKAKGNMISVSIGGGVIEVVEAEAEHMVAVSLPENASPMQIKAVSSALIPVNVGVKSSVNHLNSTSADTDSSSLTVADTKNSIVTSSVPSEMSLNLSPPPFLDEDSTAAGIPTQLVFVPPPAIPRILYDSKQSMFSIPQLPSQQSLREDLEIIPKMLQSYIDQKENNPRKEDTGVLFAVLGGLRLEEQIKALINVYAYKKSKEISDPRSFPNNNKSHRYNTTYELIKSWLDSKTIRDLLVKYNFKIETESNSLKLVNATTRLTI